MKNLEIELQNETGLHARPASLFIREASKYTSDIVVIKDGTEYNGKSIMGILSMGASKGNKLTIKIKGIDEEQAYEGLKLLFENEINKN
ncbi:HPr family phosphocarrier protein [Clostridium sp. D2Q-14]|uniref:HPr family phosphocarrier protein n=1 Tax=Anaeromonas gelatinilytica TaxID=2683194 RepID=UPI00193C325D|nr:HPr family phosphocarrier protein [Anaeromonas gelatinilytica]MBS4534064.1 HPr family phosphocarrier protein [Anaeromonas gelatinilytica]